MNIEYVEMANAYSNSEDTLGARKRKLEDIMRNEPKRVTQYPILLSSTRPNNEVASNFFEVWLDDKYQEDFVYCQASRKFVTRYKRDNSNLVRHLKMFNQGNATLRADGHLPRQTLKRVRERTCSTSELAPMLNTGGEEGASAASAFTWETGSTSTTDSISTTPLPEREPNSTCSVSISVRGRPTSNHHLEGVTSDANFAASGTTQEEQTPPLPRPLLQAAPLEAALLPTHSLVDPQYGLDSEDEEPQDQPSSRDPHLLNSVEAWQVGGGRKRLTQFIESECPRVFRNAMFCKTFKPVDEDADLDTILVSFRDVLHRELAYNIALHPPLKVWVGLTNLYDYKNKGFDQELSIKTKPIFISTQEGIDSLIDKVESYILGRNSSFTVLSSDLSYVRNINITLNIAQWDMRAAGGKLKKHKV